MENSDPYEALYKGAQGKKGNNTEGACRAYAGFISDREQMGKRRQLS